MTAFSVGGAAAQSVSDTSLAGAESSHRVAAETDWSVFVENDPTECWVVSGPKETVNTRNGRVVAVKRGDILLFVSYRPGTNVAGEVSFTGGYPFGENSTVALQIGSDTYELFTDGDWAWPAGPEQDAKIVASLKTGAQAIATGISSRGTSTRDTFSLMGVTAALEEAARRCTN